MCIRTCIYTLRAYLSSELCKSCDKTHSYVRHQTSQHLASILPSSVFVAGITGCGVLGASGGLDSLHGLASDPVSCTEGRVLTVRMPDFTGQCCQM